jgi:hypothetical protein
MIQVLDDLFVELDAHVLFLDYRSSMTESRSRIREVRFDGDAHSFIAHDTQVSNFELRLREIPAGFARVMRPMLHEMVDRYELPVPPEPASFKCTLWGRPRGFVSYTAFLKHQTRAEHGRDEVGRHTLVSSTEVGLRFRYTEKKGWFLPSSRSRKKKAAAQ